MMPAALWSIFMLAQQTPPQAWRPLLDPLPLHRFWPLLLIPLVAALAAVYKAIKLPRIERFGREVAGLAAQIVGLLVLAAVVLWVVTELV